MDDDLKVTEKTDLEKLLEIIENLNFDLIGAMFDNSWFQIIFLTLNGCIWDIARIETYEKDHASEKFGQKNLFKIDRNQDGFCYSRQSRKKIEIPNYPARYPMTRDNPKFFDQLMNTK